MLKLLSSSSGNADALHGSTASLEDEISFGKASDVWGLGCLLYELLTGEYLLFDDDWVRFFMRVTLATEELIPDEKAAKWTTTEQLQAMLTREWQLHESAGRHGLFEEGSDMEDDELPQNEIILHAANARQFKQNSNAQSYKSCQTPPLKRGKPKRRVHSKSQSKIAKRRPRFLRLWRLCRSCCWRREVDGMR